MQNFESKNLKYHEITQADTNNLIRWRSNPETYIYFRNPKPITRDEHLNWYNKTYLPNPNRTDFIITEKITQTPIGFVGVSNQTNTEAEISYIIGELKFQRQGFGTEAINAAVQHFSQKGIITFTAEIHKENLASIKTIEKCGFIQTDIQCDFLLYFRPYALTLK